VVNLVELKHQAQDLMILSINQKEVLQFQGIEAIRVLIIFQVQVPIILMILIKADLAAQSNKKLNLVWGDRTGLK
jgi:hypothetical protein